MNLEEQILKEHSKKNTDLITGYIEKDPVRFNMLMDLFFHGEYRIVQRAAWVMSDCAKAYPKLIMPYIDKLVLNLKNSDKHPAVKRNTLRILQGIEVPERLHGELLNLCFDFVADRKEAVAIKAFAMTIVYNIGKHEPDLMHELKILIEDQMPYTSAAFRSRGSKILKALQ